MEDKKRKETNANIIDIIRYFLIIANKQFEEEGIRLDRVIFDRDDDGNLSGVRLSYEDTKPDDEKTEEDGR